MLLTAQIRRDIRRLEITSRRLLAGSLGGEYRTLFRGRGLEFSEIRPYEAGDDVRLLDWNVTARTGIPHIRLQQEERSRTLTLLADVSPSCAGSKRQLLLQTAALLAFAAGASRDLVGMVAFSGQVERLVPPGRGRNHTLGLLSDLMTLQPQGRDTDLAPALEAALAANRRPGILILLSDFHTALPEALLRKAVLRHDLIALVLRDPLETCLPQAGLFLVRDVETGRERLLDLSSAGRRAAVRRGWEENDRRLHSSLERLGIDHALLDGTSSPASVLHGLFRARKRRRR